jgi:hypothetical protein
VLDAELGAEQVELVLSGSGAFSQAEQPVGVACCRFRGHQVRFA